MPKLICTPVDCETSNQLPTLGVLIAQVYSGVFRTTSNIHDGSLSALIWGC